MKAKVPVVNRCSECGVLGAPCNCTMRCDFCQGEGPFARTFQVKGGGTLIATYPNQIVIDDGEWLACVTCEALAEFKDWSHVLDRTVIGTLARFPQLPDTDDTRRVLREKQAFLLSLVFDQKVSA